jgi:hypothetical protein
MRPILLLGTIATLVALGGSLPPKDKEKGKSDDYDKENNNDYGNDYDHDHANDKSNPKSRFYIGDCTNPLYPISLPP